MVLVSNNNPASTPPRQANPSLTNTSFPLQSGSNNSYVKQLQQALGVSADGIFGPVTAAALQNQFGYSSVPDQNTLTAIVKATGSQATSLRNNAMGLYNQFQAGGYDVQVQSAYFADEVTEDNYGHLTPTGMGFDMVPGYTFDNTTYTLDGVTVLGLLILKVSSGGLQGEYTIDASSITLVPHQPQPNGSILPVTDPNTGLTYIPL